MCFVLLFESKLILHKCWLVVFVSIISIDRIWIFLFVDTWLQNMCDIQLLIGSPFCSRTECPNSGSKRRKYGAGAEFSLTCQTAQWHSYFVFGRVWMCTWRPTAMTLVFLWCLLVLPVQDQYTLTLRRLMSYIYGAPILDVSRSHTTTHHSR